MAIFKITTQNANGQEVQVSVESVSENPNTMQDAIDDLAVAAALVHTDTTIPAAPPPV